MEYIKTFQKKKHTAKNKNVLPVNYRISAAVYHKHNFYLKTVYFNRIRNKQNIFNIKGDNFQRLCFNF